MGGGLPYAIAAALAYPGRQVVAIVGDGGLSMSVAELATCVRYRLPVKVVVLNNGSLAQIKWEQMLFLGNPEYGCELAARQLRPRGTRIRRAWPSGSRIRRTAGAR